MIKTQILEAVGSLPEDASFEDTLEKIYSLHKIKRECLERCPLSGQIVPELSQPEIRLATHD